MEGIINIFGSCVTRDVFSFNKKDHLVDTYIARQSLHSFMSIPVDIPEPAASYATGSWKERMVWNDLAKANSEIFSNKILLVDLIDERHNLLKVGGSIITETKELVESGILDDWEITKIKRGSSYDFIEWEKACKKFKLYILQNNIRIVFHEAYWAEMVMNGDEMVLHERSNFIEFQNQNLKNYNSVFIDIVQPEFVIKIDSKLRIASADHKWGMAPFHYINEYYKAAFDLFAQKIPFLN